MNAETSSKSGADWRDQIFDILQSHDIKQVYHVPDAGHSRLIEHCQRSNSIRTVALTTEEEGIALAVLANVRRVVFPNPWGYLAPHHFTAKHCPDKH